MAALTRSLLSHLPAFHGLIGGHMSHHCRLRWWLSSLMAGWSWHVTHLWLYALPVSTGHNCGYDWFPHDQSRLVFRKLVVTGHGRFHCGCAGCWRLGDRSQSWFSQIWGENRTGPDPQTLIILLQGHRITPFESPWSTMIKIELNPLLIGRLVMKSIVTCWNGRWACDLIGISGAAVGWVFISICWQVVHPSVNCLVITAIPGQ